MHVNGLASAARRVASWVIVASVAAASALVLESCASTSSTSTTLPASATSSSSSAQLVTIANNPKLGPILVDSKGLTLYTLVSGPKPVSCTDPDCKKVWPLLLVHRGVVTVTGGQGVSDLGKSKSGTVVTYMGYPLARFAGDLAPGETNGDNVASSGGVWHVAKPGVKPGT